MTVYYGTVRPQVMKIVSWDGDNIVEVKEALGPDLATYFFINEENNNLCYGLTIDDCLQYPVGTLLSGQGGVTVIDPENWNVTYQEVDNNGRLKYTITEDAVPAAVTSRKKSS